MIWEPSPSLHYITVSPSKTEQQSEGAHEPSQFLPAFPHQEMGGRYLYSVHQSPGPRLRVGPWEPLAGLFLTLEGSAIQLLEITISLLASTVTVCPQEGSLVSDRCSSRTGVGPPLGLAFLSARPSPWSHQGPRNPVAQCASSSAPHLPQVLHRAASQGHRHSKDAPSGPEAHGAGGGGGGGGVAGEAHPAVQSACGTPHAAGGKWWQPSLPSGGQAVTYRAAACRVQLRAGTMRSTPLQHVCPRGRPWRSSAFEPAQNVTPPHSEGQGRAQRSGPVAAALRPVCTFYVFPFSFLSWQTFVKAPLRVASSLRHPPFTSLPRRGSQFPVPLTVTIVEEGAHV